MKLIVDANRVVSALIRDGSTRSAILKTGAALYAPEFLQEEIARHLPALAQRIGVTPEELTVILTPLLKRIEWVSEAAYRSNMEEAKRAIETVDPKDVPYLACALAVAADAIWSHDLDFDKQTLVPRVPHPDAEIP